MALAVLIFSEGFGTEVIMPLQDSVVNEYGSISHHGHYSDNDPKKPTYSCCTALEKYMNGNDEECLTIS